MQIPNAKLRRSIVDLVEQIAGPEDQWIQRPGNLGGLTSTRNVIIQPSNTPSIVPSAAASSAQATSTSP
jgi:hypothetical protein